jgi:predicted amidohydrolase YtcJ
MRATSSVLALLLAFPHAASTRETPSTPIRAVVGAKIWTGNPEQPWATALALDGDRIAQVGDDATIRAAVGDGNIVDAGGRLLVPGFIDTHVHFVDGGFRLSSVQLRDAKDRDTFASRIGAFAREVPKGTWITGGDWDHSLWGGELPQRAWIDAVTPDHPVWINRLDGHMALANSAALKAAGITRETKDVEGGEIVRDADGEPTGVLKDNAMALVDRVVATPSAAMRDRALAAAMRYVNAQGVTSLHAMGTWEDLDTYARMPRDARTVRIYAAVPLSTWERLAKAVAAKRYGGADGRGDAMLRVGLLKGFVDGSLGSHTAAFHEPFTDAPKDRGLLVTPVEELRTSISGADAAGLHVTVHAIGDRANGLLLDLYDAIAREHGARDRRFRIEHAQHLAKADIPRFAKLGVIASMQPYHAIDDGRWAEKVIGERIDTTYAFRDLLDAGARLAFGSDWYVAPPTPLEGIYAAVTRRTIDDRNPGGWVPRQKIGVEEALRAYTATAAYASFEEKQKGVLAPGYLADFVVLDRDLFEIDPVAIRDVRVVMTVVGGRGVHGGLPDAAPSVEAAGGMQIPAAVSSAAR